MLTTPKKGAKKNEPATPSETASFKKVAYGFSPDEVNLYLHRLRKEKLELQAENDTLSAQINRDDIGKLETLERNLREANERYFKEKELTTMLTEECGRLGQDMDKLTTKLSKSGSSEQQAAAKVAEAEANAKKAEVKATKAEARVVDAEARAADAEAKLAKIENKITDFENRIIEYKSRIAEYENVLRESDNNLAESQKNFNESQKNYNEAQKSLTEALNKNKSYEAQIAGFDEKMKDAENAVATAKAAEASALKSIPILEDIPALGDASMLDDIPVLDDIPELPAAPKKPAPAPAPAPAPKKPAPRAASDVDMSFAEFQVPEQEAYAPPPEKNDDLANNLNSLLAEMDDLRSRIAKAEELKTAAKEAEEKKAADKKAKKAEESGRMSRAELKIQIFQEESEDSYIIPEKYLKMIEDVEGQEEEDDFSYLLTDSSPMDDRAFSMDDDMDNLLVSAPPVSSMPSFSQAPPPAAKKAAAPAPAPQPARAPQQAPRPAAQQQPAAQSAQSMKLAPRPVQQKPEPDENFAELLTRDFNKPQPKGDGLAPRNPKQVDRGDDLVARNPHQKEEKGADMDPNLFTVGAGDLLAAPGDDFSGYDFMLESDDDII
jgi:hypothetical protein